MKKVICIAFVSVFSLGYAQETPFEIFENDTINYTDENNLKQGFWKIWGKTKRLPDYDPDQVVEEGPYKNSRKMGLWKKFFASGKIKSEITYVNNRPNGNYKIYYQNGEVEEEGSWKNNRNTGEFKRYYENGQMSQNFVFNATGKRDGKQEYFYENGQLMIDADISNGKENFVKEYYENGDLKAEKSFVDGKLDAENSKTYEPKEPIKDREIEELEKAPEKVITIEKDEKANTGTFDGNGYKKMYNRNKQISKDGTFKNYRLMDGKWYKYNEDGILIGIEIFKKGKYIGDAPLPKE